MLQGHSGPVTGLAAHLSDDGGLTLVSTAGDGAVRVCECAPSACSSSGSSTSSSAGDQQQPLLGQDAWALQQSIDWGVQLQHSLALSAVPGCPGWYAWHRAKSGDHLNMLASSVVPWHCAWAAAWPHGVPVQAAARAGRCGQQHLAAAAAAGGRVPAGVPPEGPHRLGALAGVHASVRSALCGALCWWATCGVLPACSSYRTGCGLAAETPARCEQYC